jgi:DNA-binding NarL/FixJ family response regulator
MHKKGEAARIFLVEDHPVVRECLRGCLNRETEFEICAEADQAKGTIERIHEVRPDLVILDISLHGGSGFDLIKAIKAKCPKMKILIFSMHDEKLYAERCIRAGASGYVMKRESTDRLLTAIRDVLDGKTSVSEKIMTVFAQKFVEGHKSDENLRRQNLSDRELMVLDLLGSGLSSRKIGQSLDISVKTVHAHCANIKQKLGLSSARELLREATKWHDGNSAFE